MTPSIIVLNTGSTSTKLAVYQGQTPVLQKEYVHPREELKGFRRVAEQRPLRQKLAEDFLTQEAAAYGPFQAIVARGGILTPIHSGGYVINQAMVDYLDNVCQEEHASNLAAGIALELAHKYGIPHAYIYDGITTDELAPIARISGIPEMPRTSITHCLNMRAIAHKLAADLGRPYDQITVAVAHLGGGISMSLHHQGQIVDFVGDDEGPFAPERAGGQQCLQLIKYLEGKTFTEKLHVMRGDSGFIAYFGTTDAREVERRIAEGDEEAALVHDALAYQVAKYLATLSVYTCGKLDSIAITGGLARSALLMEKIKARVSFLAPVHIYPGENEMESLALGACRILSGEEQAREFVYQPK